MEVGAYVERNYACTVRLCRRRCGWMLLRRRRGTRRVWVCAEVWDRMAVRTTATTSLTSRTYPKSSASASPRSSSTFTRLSYVLHLQPINALAYRSTGRYQRTKRRSVVMATELLQPRDLPCGPLFQSSCVILTSPMDCSDDSWRDTFLRRSVTSGMRRHRKAFTYLLIT